MDQGDVARQLKQMTDFIRLEAVEKASEIEVASAEVTLGSASAVRSSSRGLVSFGSRLRSARSGSRRVGSVALRLQGSVLC